MEIKNKDKVLLKDKKVDENYLEDNQKLKIVSRNIFGRIKDCLSYIRFDLSKILKDISLDDKEPPLYYNNKISFTKEVDNKIQKYNIYNISKYESFLNILMIAEKPSIARTIAKILSEEDYVEYKFESINIFVFKGYFKGICSYFTVTSVKGHLYTNESDEYYDYNYPEEFYEYTTIKTLKKSEIFLYF